MKDYLQVGGVTSTHGLRGEVKVFPTTDDSRRFDDLKEVFYEKKGVRTFLEIERVRYFKQFVILKFKGLDRIEDVEGLVRAELFVTRENAVPLAENEYFIADLIGLRALDEQGKELGTLTEVLATGANDVYVIEKDGRELLIPAIHDCILQVSPEEGFLRVRLMKGL